MLRARARTTSSALLRVADVTAAMSVEALLGTDRAFAEDLIALRPQPGPGGQRGQPAPAARRLADRRQPPLRTTPGCRTPTRCAARRRCTARRATRSRTPRRVAEAELGSAIDNPMVLPDGRVESCGNFHGAPLGFACDFLAIAAAEVGAIAERRTDRLLDASRSHGPAAVPRRRPGRELGADDRPVHAGGDGGREPPAGGARRASTRCRRARCRRTTSRWAGARRASCAPSLANLRAHPRRRARLRGARRSTCARPLAPGRRDRARRCAALRGARRGPGPGPLAGARAGARPRSSSVGGALLRRGRGARSESWRERAARGPRAARHRALAAAAGRRRRRCGC